MVAIYLFIQSQSQTIELRLDNESQAREWSVLGRAQTEHTRRGMLIKPQGRAVLVSPRLQNPNGILNWHRFPYIKLRIAPQDKERRMELVWALDRDFKRTLKLPFTLPASASELLLDVRQDIPWENRLSWNRGTLSRAPVRRLIIVVNDPVEVRALTLLSSLNPLQFGQLLWSQYWKIEPIRPNSINALWGNNVLGVPVSSVFGTAFIILLLSLLVVRREKYRRVLFGAMLACLVAPEAPFILTLWEQAQASSKVSAWHADRYDEYRSRFGEEFAELDRAFQKHVPVGSRVAFPESKRELIWGASNWLWFLYYGLYENYTDRDINSTHISNQTEYLFYYYPSGLVHDEEQDLLRLSRGDKHIYKTQTVVRINAEAKILRIIHG